MLKGVTRNDYGYGGLQLDESAPRSVPARFVLNNPRDLLLGVIALGVGGAICVNALYLQPGPHPAPIFAVKAASPPAPASSRAATSTLPVTSSPMMSRETTGAVALLPRPRPPEASQVRPVAAKAATGAARPDPIGDLIGRPAAEPARPAAPQAAAPAPAPAKLAAAGPAPPLPASPSAKAVSTASGGLAPPTAPAVSSAAGSASAAAGPAVESVQRALRDFGYGQVKVSGNYDAETRATVEQFERQRGLPVTGQLNERTLRELDKVVGPLR